MKILNVVGARPNFIKVAPIIEAINKHNVSVHNSCTDPYGKAQSADASTPLSSALQQDSGRTQHDHHSTERSRRSPERGETESKDDLITSILVHTGQHYDYEMSKIFFDELQLETPDYNLEVGSGPHGWQTGEMLRRIEEVLIEERPDVVMVYGDTNSTLAGALAASKLLIPVAHVEAGVRSFNREMPEEINRLLTDRLSSYLFCPMETAVRNLAKEGITDGVYNVGDVMYDTFLHNVEIAEAKSKILDRLGLKLKGYLLATVHRAENTDDPDNLKNILTAFRQTRRTILLPLHPRARKRIQEFDLSHLLAKNITVIDPVSYLDMLMLEKNAEKILTDSGGMQKEAYWLEVPCITLRCETEWAETVAAGWNILAGADKNKILEAAGQPIEPIGSSRPVNQKETSRLYGDGNASGRIISILSISIGHTARRGV